MIRALPSFDELAELARTHPDQFERLRAEVCDAFINEAPEKCRSRLRGLQFRIDMERRRCSNPMASCIRISAMMHNSLDRLRLLLSEYDSLDEASGSYPLARANADVVSMAEYRKTKARDAGA